MFTKTDLHPQWIFKMADAPQDSPPDLGERSYYVIGLVGGVASGKSFVAEQFRRLGAVVLDADQVGHEVLRLPSVIAAARERWGESILNADGQIDRQALGRIVFADTNAGRADLKYLTEITHPLIAQRVAQAAAAISETGTPAVVLDAPLLVEAGWDRLCDRIVYVDAPVDVRRARAIERGWSEEEFRRREAVQEKLDVKRNRADAIIDNSASAASTQAQIERFWNSLIGCTIPPRRSFPA
jgi:dephospho-CoA kinase